MRTVAGPGIVALMLWTGGTFAAAQGNPPADQSMQPAGPPVAEGKTVPAPRLPTQPPGMEADNAKPTMLQPEHNQTAGQLPAQVIGATPQTMPSTISAENAKQDDLPILAQQFPLTDEQKQKIAAIVGKATVTTGGKVQADVTQVVPSGVEMNEFPVEASAAVPGVERYRYVKLSDRVLIVDPLFDTVVSEIVK